MKIDIATKKTGTAVVTWDGTHFHYDVMIDGRINRTHEKVTYKAGKGSRSACRLSDIVETITTLWPGVDITVQGRPFSSSIVWRTNGKITRRGEDLTAVYPASIVR